MVNLLRNDDVRFEGFKDRCYLSALDDVRHLVMLCPKCQSERSKMISVIANIKDGCGQALLDSQCNLLYLRYRHLIPTPVDRVSASAWLYKAPNK